VTRYPYVRCLLFCWFERDAAEYSVHDDSAGQPMALWVTDKARSSARLRACFVGSLCRLLVPSPSIGRHDPRCLLQASHRAAWQGAPLSRRSTRLPLNTPFSLIAATTMLCPLSPLCSLQSHRPQQPPQSQIQQQRGPNPPPMQSQGRGTRAGQSALIPVLSSFAAKPPALEMCAPGCGAPGADSRLNYVLPSISGTAGLDASRSVPSPPEASSKIVLCREGTIT
jgi:hypothetical protein